MCGTFFFLSFFFSLFSLFSFSLFRAFTVSALAGIVPALRAVGGALRHYGIMPPKTLIMLIMLKHTETLVMPISTAAESGGP